MRSFKEYVENIEHPSPRLQLANLLENAGKRVMMAGEFEALKQAFETETNQPFDAFIQQLEWIDKNALKYKGREESPVQSLPPRYTSILRGIS